MDKCKLDKCASTNVRVHNVARLAHVCLAVMTTPLRFASLRFAMLLLVCDRSRSLFDEAASVKLVADESYHQLSQRPKGCNKRSASYTDVYWRLAFVFLRITSRSALLRYNFRAILMWTHRDAQVHEARLLCYAPDQEGISC